ncbi:MAG: MerR family transcriptional regulator [Dehalococcoidia bacterium]|nr:MerR family transcriptional regulator [Dehalococcoidia bacterium]
MRVSELSRRVGLAASAIRFYEASGVLPRPSRGANGYREYGEPDVTRLRVFASLRGLGIDLAECARLASLCAAGECDAMDIELLPQVASRRAEVAAARRELDHLDVQLAGLEAAIRGGRFREHACGSEEGGTPCESCQC